jgi:thiosulfate/3-mercaptopyruvate sulfurtransferase
MAGSKNLAPLVEAGELLRLASAQDVRILDCRHELAKPQWGATVYAEGHIPGAIFASLDRDLSSPIRPGTGRHPLPSPADFAATLGRWGIGPGTRVIAYDHGPGAWAARLWWMLRAVGHRAVQVLDGGYAAWLAAGYAADAALPVVAPAAVAERGFDGVASTADVVAGLAARSITLMDARAADRFAGRNETIDPVAGHVPGAVNMPFLGNLDPAQRFLDAAQLRQRWAPLLDQPALPPIVAMCGSGITACHNLLALEMAGVTGARLYVGSFSEWITDPARPVVTEDSSS